MKTLSLLCVLASSFVIGAEVRSAEPLDVGSRRELFVDDALIDALEGDATLLLHRPEPREVVLVTDQPWEGNTCAYYTIFQDGELYRMYYRGSHWDEQAKQATHREVTCYAESRDGVHWSKPGLGLFEFGGSQDNNIVLDGLGTHCFVAFKDANPDCPPEARYKGIARGRPVGKKGLYVFQSADGIRWSLIKDEPVITEGAFDSQNLAFWHPLERQYVDYHRTFSNGVRAIMRCTSDDFVNWSQPQLLQFPGAPNQHLYTNAIRAYPRAPHLYVGFPTRYLPEGESVEPLFMSSRDGLTFHRWNEPVILQSAPQDRAGNRSNYMANGLIVLPDNQREYAVYGTEAYYTGPDSRLRRFTWRLDGFVSLHAGAEGGALVTKPLVYSGSDLSLNFTTGESGTVRITLLSADAEDALGSSTTMRGDEIDGRVSWPDPLLADYAGQPVRLRFELTSADVYSFQFGGGEPTGAPDVSRLDDDEVGRTADRRAIRFATDPAAHDTTVLKRPPETDAWKQIAPYFQPPSQHANDFGRYRSPLLFADGSPVLTADDWQRRRGELLRDWHALLGEWPPLLTDQQLQVVETMRRENFTQHRVRFRWTPTETTVGYLLIPDGEGERPAVVTVYYEPETAIGLGKEHRDFALQLARRGFVTLSIGTTEATAAHTYGLYYPSIDDAQVQPLSMLACAAANAWHALAKRPEVDPERIGIMGHSFGGKWAMFAACLFDKFAAAAWSDPGIVFDESRPNVNYWEPWYLGYHPPPWRERGVITAQNPARGLYPRLVASGRDLHELHALMAPRPFLVSGGSEDPPRRWAALNHSVAVNRLLGLDNRVALTSRPEHSPDAESNAAIYAFFEHFLAPTPSDKRHSTRVEPHQRAGDSEQLRSSSGNPSREREPRIPSSPFGAERQRASEPRSGG